VAAAGTAPQSGGTISCINSSVRSTCVGVGVVLCGGREKGVAACA
jgi:hypothetical protein